MLAISDRDIVEFRKMKQEIFIGRVYEFIYEKFNIRLERERIQNIIRISEKYFLESEQNIVIFICAVTIISSVGADIPTWAKSILADFSKRPEDRVLEMLKEASIRSKASVSLHNGF